MQRGQFSAVESLYVLVGQRHTGTPNLFPLQAVQLSYEFSQDVQG